jgi:hypothetical protein
MSRPSDVHQIPVETTDSQQDYLIAMGSKTDTEEASPPSAQSDLDLNNLGEDSLLTRVSNLQTRINRTQAAYEGRHWWHLADRESFRNRSTSWSPLSSHTSRYEESDRGSSAMAESIITLCCRALLHAFTNTLAAVHVGGITTESSGGSQASARMAGAAKGQSVSASRECKRRCEGEDDQTDDNHDNGRNPLKRPKVDIICKPHRPLACPFNKCDNVLFGLDSYDTNYHACATFSCITIGHLKYVPQICRLYRC